MSKTLEALREFLETIPNGRVRKASIVATLLSACWNDLIGEAYKEGVTPDQILLHADKMQWDPPKLTFQMRRLRKNSLYTEEWLVDTKRGVVLDLVFDKILQLASATKLIKAGVSPLLLRVWFRTITDASWQSGQRDCIRREAASIAEECLSLAEAIRHANESSRVLTPDERDEWHAFPRTLASFAEMCERIHRRPRNSSELAWAINGLVTCVENVTGTEHYREVTDLLNAMNDLPQYHRPRKEERDVSDVKQMVWRERQRLGYMEAIRQKPARQPRANAKK